MKYKKIKQKLKSFFCNHFLRGINLSVRDEKGLVSWPCSKCGIVFRASCGLDILAGKNIKCDGKYF